MPSLSRTQVFCFVFFCFTKYSIEKAQQMATGELIMTRRQLSPSAYCAREFGKSLLICSFICFQDRACKALWGLEIAKSPWSPHDAGHEFFSFVFRES